MSINYLEIGNDLSNLIEKIINTNLIFITPDLKNKIREAIKIILPKLKKSDRKILFYLIQYLINYMFYQIFNLNKTDKIDNKYYQQFIQNDYQDIKSICLLLIPFINNNDQQMEKLTQLKYILFESDERVISNDIAKIKDVDCRKKYFKFSNFAIGLLKSGKKELLNLYNPDTHMIYEIIYNNYISLLETIKIVSNKLYINWINITPFTLSNYKKSKLYLNTKNNFLKINKNPNNINYGIKNGLWYGDFYNTLVNSFYKNIRNVKFLFYPYFVKNRYYYTIQILHLTLLDIDKIVNNKDISRHKFTSNLYVVANKILHNEKYKKIPSNVIKQSYSAILYFFINKYSNKNEISKIPEFSKFIIESKLKNINYIKIKNHPNNEIFEAIIKIPIEHFIKFIYESVNMIQASPFNSYLFKDNKFDSEFSTLYNTKYLNLKNIYNFGKYIYLQNNKTDYYRALSKKQKINFLKDFVIRKNLNINKNFERQLLINSKLSDSERISKSQKINSLFNNEISQYILDIIFESLIRSGILSEFIPDISITDKNKTSKIKNERVKIIKKILKKKLEKSEYLDSYYYLTNKKYKDLNKIRKKENNIHIEYSYFDLLTSKYHDWYTYYAMDWISQIKFFHNYLNNQVTFVTGSTGQGKSTQIPKLFAYALKAVDYKSQGKVICTQPRKRPTEDNAQWVSEQLGIPIFQHSNYFGKQIKTNNYYMQFKHQDYSHEKKSTSHIQIKFTTDGSLIEELFLNDNIMFTDSVVDYNSENNSIVVDEYKDTNKCDIIIIDEAHEHNTNMDLILTKMRDVCYYNPSIRLSIVSATMDDDEPIYRSYYSCLDDFFLYPQRINYYCPVVRKETYHFPNFIDRRINISPPGETTQYHIKEIYEDLDESINNDIKLSQIAQKKGIERIISILSTTTSGNILFFSNGQREIIEAVKELNTKIPKNCIALPFFTRLATVYQSMIKEIDKEIVNIINNKTYLHQEWNELFTEPKNPVSKNTYKRAVIIATNVAEASLTIPNLVYVVDNGFAKVNYFNKLKNVSELKVEKISESSRLQRKGRVGRKSNGYVYYLYKKGARENILPKYKITQDNPVEHIIRFTRRNADLNINPNDVIDYSTLNMEEYSVFINNKLTIFRLNPRMLFYNQMFLRDTREGILNKFNQIYQLCIQSNEELFKNQMLKILNSNKKDQITSLYRNSFLKSFYSKFNLITNLYNQNIFDLSHFNHSHLVENRFAENKEYVISELFLSGYQLDNNLDIYGNFYIIHYLENNVDRSVKRNIINIYKEKRINNKIIKYKEPSNQFNEKEIEIIKRYLKYRLSLIQINGETYKTKLYDRVKEIVRLTKFTSENALAVLISKSMNNFEDILMLIVLLQIINYNITSLIYIKNKFSYDLKMFKNKYKTGDSDLYMLLNIINLIKFNFDFEIFKILNKENISFEQNNAIKARDIKNIFLDSIENDKNYLEPEKLKNRKIDIDSDTYQSLYNLFLNYKFEEKDIINKLLSKPSSLTKQLSDEWKSNKPLIEEWSKQNLLKPDIIIKFFETYELILFELLGIKKDYEFSNQESSLEYFEKINSFNNPNSTKRENILKPFIYANPINICLKMNYSDRFYKDIKSTNNELEVDTRINTFVPNLKSFCFYLNYKKNNNQKDKVSLLTNFKEEYLVESYPNIYNTKNIKNIHFYDEEINNKLYYKYFEFSGDCFDNFVFQISSKLKKSDIIWITEKLPYLKRYFNIELKKLK